MTKNNYTIRPMQAADLSAVLLIEQQEDFPWTLKMLEDCLAADYNCWVLALPQGIIGFAILASAMQQTDILNIVVDTQHRRQGYGKLLLQHMISNAKQQKIEQLFLEVRASNMAAISLYEKLHFTSVGKRSRYYPAKQNNMEDGIVMLLNL